MICGPVAPACTAVGGTASSLKLPTCGTSAMKLVPLMLTCTSRSPLACTFWIVPNCPSTSGCSGVWNLTMVPTGRLVGGGGATSRLDSTTLFSLPSLHFTCTRPPLVLSEVTSPTLPRCWPLVACTTVPTSMPVATVCGGPGWSGTFCVGGPVYSLTLFGARQTLIDWMPWPGSTVSVSTPLVACSPTMVAMYSVPLTSISTFSPLA